MDHAKQSATDEFKTFQKESFKKQQKHLVIWLEVKLLIKLQEPQKLNHRIIQKEDWCSNNNNDNNNNNNNDNNNNNNAPILA